MDFIMEHSNLFISIGVIMLLALIGYYADKNDSKKTNSVKSSKPSTGKDDSVESVNTSNEVKNDIIDSFSKLPESIPDVATNDGGVWGNNVSFEENKEVLNNVTENVADNVVEDITPEINNELNSNDGYFDISQDIPLIDNGVEEDDIIIPAAPVEQVVQEASVIPEPVVSEAPVENAASYEQQQVENIVSEPDNGILKNVPVDAVASVPTFDSSSFENTGLSLDDLEKKNYEKIVNNMKDDSSDYSDSFDDSGVDEYISGSDDSLSEGSEAEQPTFEQENSNIDEVPTESTTFDESNESDVQPVDNTQVTSDSEDPFAFGVVEKASEDTSESSVPELNDGVVSSDLNSDTGDIWEF